MRSGRFNLIVFIVACATLFPPGRTRCAWGAADLSVSASPYGVQRSLFPIGQPRSMTDPRRAARLDYYRRQSTRLQQNPFRFSAPYGAFGGLEARRSRLQSGRFIFPHGEYESPLGRVSLERRVAFRTYGGFEARPATPMFGSSVSEALQRRTALVEATGLYAPIQRANLRNASVAGLRASLDLVPLPQTPSQTISDREPPTLSDELSRNAELAHRRKMREAWSAFRDGDYAQAVHGFKSAADLGEDHTEMEIGQVFCQVSAGAPRTAIAVLARIARQPRNPFLFELNMAEKYGRRADVEVLKARARFQASAAPDNPALLALSTFIFWYVGEIEDARSTAATLKTQSAGTVFASWPAMLEEAVSLKSKTGGAP